MASLDLDKNKKALGRGLASLIPEAVNSEGKPTTSHGKKEYFSCDIEKIIPNTYQPRKIFKKEAIEELVESIKAHGIIQPLIVRQRDGHYELIAGERRWRAAQKAGLKQVPVVVKDIGGDAPSLEMAIIENVQREDLNCIEEAIAYQQLADEFQLSQEEIAVKVGKNRATVANTMRLLKLPAAIREDITSGALTMGHARALLSLESPEDQLLVREQIIKKKLNVRETERKVNDVLKGKDSPTGSPAGVDTNLKALEEELKRQYGSVVRIVGNDKRGFIQFVYSDRDGLMRLADMLKGRQVAESTLESALDAALAAPEPTIEPEPEIGPEVMVEPPRMVQPPPLPQV